MWPALSIWVMALCSNPPSMEVSGMPALRSSSMAACWARVPAESVVGSCDGVDRKEQDECAAEKRQILPDAILIEPQKEDQPDGKKEQEIAI